MSVEYVLEEGDDVLEDGLDQEELDEVSEDYVLEEGDDVVEDGHG